MSLVISHLLAEKSDTRRVLLATIAVALITGCSTSPQGRSRITTPVPLSNVYSAVDMHIELATTSGISQACNGDECEQNLTFDRQVQEVGGRLSNSAFLIYPELKKRIDHFNFIVAERNATGTISNSAGTIVVFRGVQKNSPDDHALAWILAREMAHVIGRHHDENAAPRMMLSILTAIIFPGLNIVRASMPTSYLGSKLIMASLKPGQLRESEAIAIKLVSAVEVNDPVDLIALNAPVSSDLSFQWSQPSPSLM